MPSATLGRGLHGDRAWRVSNPSRGTCAFGQKVASQRTREASLCLKPLSGNVCLRPQRLGLRFEVPVSGLKPLSGNVCLRPPWQGNNKAPTVAGLKPLSGNVCLRPQLVSLPHGRSEGVSNPSRGTCAFGLGDLPPDDFRREVCLKPLSGNVCLRPQNCLSDLRASSASLKPLSGNVCLRPRQKVIGGAMQGMCLKPLSGNVCLRPQQGADGGWQRPRLKPLSGNVCLRPKAMARKQQGADGSQTPLGERVPSAPL